jgi:hypothetical protein
MPTLSTRTKKSKKTKVIEGGGPLPPKDILHQIAKATYQTNAPKTIGPFALVKETPTLKFYRANDTIVVGIRGTNPTDTSDLKADLTIPFNGLANSARFKKDVADIKSAYSAFHPDEYDYYGVGHSLGGAIMDELIEMGLLDEGVSYNGAVQPKHQSNTKNQRNYHSGDLLYQTMGRSTKNHVVRESKPQSFWERALNALPIAKGLKWLYTKYKNHGLENFEGGRHPLDERVKMLLWHVQK